MILGLVLHGALAGVAVGAVFSSSHRTVHIIQAASGSLGALYARAEQGAVIVEAGTQTGPDGMLASEDSQSEFGTGFFVSPTEVLAAGHSGPGRPLQLIRPADVLRSDLMWLRRGMALSNLRTAGVRESDEITALDGRPVGSVTAALQLLLLRPPAHSISIEYTHGIRVHRGIVSVKAGRAAA